MITFELIAFIKKHLEKHTPRETITNLLLEKGGWYQADIDEAFQVALYGHQVHDELFEE